MSILGVLQDSGGDQSQMLQNPNGFEVGVLSGMIFMEKVKCLQYLLIFQNWDIFIHCFVALKNFIDVFNNVIYSSHSKINARS